MRTTSVSTIRPVLAGEDHSNSDMYLPTNKVRNYQMKLPLLAVLTSPNPTKKLHLVVPNSSLTNQNNASQNCLKVRSMSAWQPWTHPRYVITSYWDTPHLTSIPFTTLMLGIGTALRQSAAATLLRVARMAQGPHSGPPNQMPAPRARPVQAYCGPSAPPASQLDVVETSGSHAESPA
jgi:hypothetical protein